jgi:hypothetical protein
LQSWPRLCECADQVLAKFVEVPLDSAAAADHHVIRAGIALLGENFAGESAKAALHAVADDGPADLLADGEANAAKRIAIVTMANEEHKAGCRRTPSGVRSEEIRAFPKGD